MTTGDDPLLGKTIDGRYVLRRRIGRGGMGVVYEAEHAALDRRVAIKLIAAAEAPEAYLVRFRREAKLASRITHEHLVHIYDVGTDVATGADYIVMELVEGKDLGRELDAGPMEIERAVAIAKQLLEGLAAVHAGGIIHRDIKPQNVMLTTRSGERDFVKVMDFGIARALGDASLTVTGHVMGTPSFMSPEQLRGKPLDHRTDLYAVGVTLFAMIAGKLPFEGKDTAELAGAHVFKAPPSLATLRPETPLHLVTAVARALAKAPEDRFADAAAFARALEAATPAPATQVARPRRQRSPWIGAIALLVLLGAAGAAGYVMTRARAAEEPELAAPRPPPPPIDAAISVAADAAPAIDATVIAEGPETPIAAATPGKAVPDKRPRPPDGPIRNCQCIPADAPDIIALCHDKGAPLCRCDTAAGRTLCPVPMTLKVCAKSDVDCFPNGYMCPDMAYATYHLPGRADEPCTGYHIDQYEVPKGDKIAGHFECDVCSGAKLESFKGHEGEPCTGFYWRTGEQKAGKLAHCQ